MTEQTRPTLVAPRKSESREIIPAPAQFDPDFYHVIEREDDALIAEELMHGRLSGAFVYSFEISGKPVQGISVIGAAHMARKFGGLKHRIVASTEKRGTLFKFTSYPHEGSPMQVTAAFINELADEPDYYTAVVEIDDIKTGNTIQVEKTEMRMESKRDGSMFERPNFQTIAQSKAYRNAVLRIVPQDVQIMFKTECIKLGKSKDVTRDMLDEKRTGVIAFAAKHAIAVDRNAVYELNLAQIDGLRGAAENGVPAFCRSLEGLGLIKPAIEQVRDTGTQEGDPRQQQGEQIEAKKRRPAKHKDEQTQPDGWQQAPSGVSQAKVAENATAPQQQQTAANKQPKDAQGQTVQHDDDGVVQDEPGSEEDEVTNLFDSGE